MLTVRRGPTFNGDRPLARADGRPKGQKPSVHTVNDWLEGVGAD
jgi:hypothetical protein